MCFFKNIQQHVRHSTIISHNVADTGTWGRWRGESQNDYNVWVLKTNRNSFLVLCVCTHKEAVTERKREKRLKGDACRRTPEPRGEGGSLCSAGAGGRAPALQQELPKLTPTPIPTSIQEGWDWNLSIWPALRKGNATLCRHLGNETQWEHRTIRKTLGNSEKHPGFFSPNLILPKKIPSFLDIYIEEMYYNLPTPRFYPCQSADLGC